MTKEENIKVPISIRAFEGRMKRHMLSKESEELKKCRYGSRGYDQLGQYYFVDIATNQVTSSRGLSLETLVAWAREDGVLKPYEEIDGRTASLAGARAEHSKVTALIKSLKGARSAKAGGQH